MEATIFRHEVLQTIDKGEPFKLVFITADKKRGTGGDIKSVVNWVKHKGEVIQLPGRTLKREEKDALKAAPGLKTFNIYNPTNPGDHVTKVHYRLMQFFNGKRIID